MVAFQSQNKVRFAVDDFGRNRFLGPHGVDHYDCSLDVHKAQKLGNCRDFVRFLRAGDLAQRQTQLTGPNAHRVQRAQTVLAIMAAPRRLAIDSKDRFVNRLPLFGDTRFKSPFQIFAEMGLMPAGFVDDTRPVDGTTPPAQVIGMASLPQTVSSTDWANSLPDVQLETRQGGARAVAYTLSDVDFLIGSVPGCDLRVGAADAPAVLCLIARHPAGVSLRKLAPTQNILVNGQSVTQRDLADDDRVQIGLLDIHMRIAPAPMAGPMPENLDQARHEFQATVAGFREQVVRFQREKDAFERARKQPGAAWETERAELDRELQERQHLLDERAAEIEHQESELVKLRLETANLRQQMFDHYADRRDSIASMQADLDKARLGIEEREKKLRIEEQDVADRRQRHLHQQEEIDQRTAEVSERALRFDEERRLFEQRQKDAYDDWEKKNADLLERQQVLVDLTGDRETKIKHYEADVLRLNRVATDLEERERALEPRADELTRQRDALQRDAAEADQQFFQLDEWRTKVAEEAEKLTAQKKQQDDLQRRLAERGASLEGQQATFAALRCRLERMREEIRTQQQLIDEQAAQHEATAAALKRKERAIEEWYVAMEADKTQYAQDRSQWIERSAVLETAVRQLKQTQEKLALDEERLRREAAELEERAMQVLDSDGVVQSRLAQLAETQEHLDLERRALNDRSVRLVEREEACTALQEQLQRRAEEIVARHKEVSDRLQEFRAKFAETEEKQKQLDQREKEIQEQFASNQRELELKNQLLERQHLAVTGVEGQHLDLVNQLVIQRRSHAEERAQFHMEQQAAVKKFSEARAELDRIRTDAVELIAQLPDAEVRAGSAVERLTQTREQLRNHLGEIHGYVQQCQDELEALRNRLKDDLDKLLAQEHTLRKSQDEHRLATAGFRQQLIDWQGQIGELKRLLARDETRLERKQAQVDERAKEMVVESQRLQQQAVNLLEQEREVADHREEIDRHLVDMRQWYRHKLRELAGIPLIPDAINSDAEPTILPVLPSPRGRGAGGEGEHEGNLGESEDAIVPTERTIIKITEPGDQKLGEVLREAQLIDADTLTALLAESRRQRRSLRHVLLASGVITLYQLALIEAGNIDGLALGPVRIIDRLRNTAHETVYRVFDSRRGAEAVLRHLVEADMNDALKPDEFRQRFQQAMLNDIHLANTLEVLDLAGRPAAEQEWLSGLPASDWPPLAAAPGVCYRLLTQAAQGLATAHQAGVVHGHLSDTLLFLTESGVLKICGLGEPPWLIGLQQDEEPTARDDLRTLGKIVSGWCTPTGVRKGAKTKPLPEALVSVLYRLAAEGDAGYRDVKGLLDDLQNAAAAIPTNAEAWDRLLKYVREHRTAEAMLRQSA